MSICIKFVLFVVLLLPVYSAEEPFYPIDKNCTDYNYASSEFYSIFANRETEHDILNSIIKHHVNIKSLDNYVMAVIIEKLMDSYFKQLYKAAFLAADYHKESLSRGLDKHKYVKEHDCLEIHGAYYAILNLENKADNSREDYETAADSLNSFLNDGACRAKNFSFIEEDVAIKRLKDKAEDDNTNFIALKFNFASKLFNICIEYAEAQS